ncbi:AbiTii domain-containing protein [Planosporangium mesophilum]|uniref:AbiTii domain-containing protein n=1 Tax=Planosporangium mesophilum TaxID=689768 RepID=A0A8J3TIR3_9ACTN|nr:hypothetical protein [Planosporangium mesophilum]NJC82126.1 hypothetical protein [Planosporangium mesophilum]GII22170.1 hypothetical protein Pme01_17670 [Planosporangium mesophilum]
MRRRESNLIDEIERGALDSNVSLADTLRKCMILGGQAKSAELRAWASRELSGYGPDDELPEWRTVAAPLQMDGMNLRYRWKGQQISRWELPDFARDAIKDEVQLRVGVGQLEAMLRGADNGVVRLGLPGGAELVSYINHANGDAYQTIERIYWGVSTTAIDGVLDRIRTALTELVAELRHGMADDASVPSEELATQAFHVAVSGKGHRVTVTNAQASGEARSSVGQESELDSPALKRWARIGGAIVGLATILATVFAVLQYLAT